MHQNKNQNTNDLHQPVLLDAVLKFLDPKTGDSYLDLTAGYGGHASAVLERIGTYDTAVLIDRDPIAIAELSRRFAGTGIEIKRADYLSASRELAESGRRFDVILADIGVSSPHLNDQNRGFSIQQDGPLDMRMDPEQSLTAADILNTASETEIADILRNFGEEPKAGRIAKSIVASRPLSSTKQLAAIAEQAWPGYSRVHPATRTFQAIRIAVNNELDQLQQSLPIWIDLLEDGGRLAVISFHSLEDRIVKSVFADHSGGRFDSEIKLLTKRPTTADHDELVHNPRARSAKLRVAEKIKT